MSNAFDTDLLDRRERRRRRTASLLDKLGRGAVWLGLLVVTTLFVVIAAGFSEGRERGETALSGFAMPWTWIGRLFVETASGAGIRRFTGLILVPYVGGWLAVLGFWGLRALLSLNVLSASPVAGVLAVARGAIDEAVRNKVVLVLLGLLLTALAAQPYMTLNTIDQPLRYRVQTFLSFSSLSATILLGFVTILYAAYTVATDRSERHTGDVFVKPIGRGAYLLGKFLGSVGMLAVLVATWAVVTFGVSALWFAKQAPLDSLDAEWLQTRVLTARAAIDPEPETPFRTLALEELADIRENNPERIARRGVYDLLNDLELNERSEFLSVPFPGSKTYVFENMASVKRRAERIADEVDANRDDLARRLGELGVSMRPEEVSLESILPYRDALDLDLRPAILQFKFRIGGASAYGQSESLVFVRFNDDPTPQALRYVIDQVQIIDLPATLLREDDPNTPEDETGDFSITVEQRAFSEAQLASLPPNIRINESTLQFDPETWLTVYHVEGTFVGNVARMAVAMLARLSFLAMLGTVTAALFSYPVAATLSIAIWLLSAGGSWLQMVLRSRFTATEVEAIDGTLNAFLKPLVAFIASFFARFSELDATALVIDGVQVPMGELFWHTFWIGLAWTALTFLIGWFFFSRKELARVQV